MSQIIRMVLRTFLINKFTPRFVSSFLSPKVGPSALDHVLMRNEFRTFSRCFQWLMITRKQRWGRGRQKRPPDANSSATGSEQTRNSLWGGSPRVVCSYRANGLWKSMGPGYAFLSESLAQVHSPILPQPASLGLVLTTVQPERVRRVSPDDFGPCSVDKIGGHSQCSLEQIYPLLRINRCAQQCMKTTYIHFLCDSFAVVETNVWWRFRGMEH